MMKINVINKNACRICCIAVLLFALCSVMQTVYANPINEAYVNRDTKIVTISGKFDASKSGKRITLKVLYPGKQITEDDPSSSEPIRNILNYADQAYTASDGSYSFSYPITRGSQSGIYTVSVGIDGDSALYTDSFIYYTSDDINEIIKAVNNSSNVISDENYIGKVLSLKHKGTNQTYFDVLELSFFITVDQNNVYNAFIDAKNLKPNKHFANIGDLQTEFNKAVLVEAMNEADDAAAIDAIFTNHMGILKINETVTYSTYANMDIKDQTAVKEFLADDSFSSINDIFDSFNDHVILQFVGSENTHYWEICPKLYELRSYERLTVDFSDLNQNDMAKIGKLIHKQYSIIKSLNEALSDAIKTVKFKGFGSERSRDTRNSNTTNITINSTPVLPKVLKFKDLGGVPWAEECIEILAAKNIINGQENGIFGPNDLVTREQFVKMLVIAFGLLDDNATSDFSDLGKNQWYYKYICSAQRFGLTKGREDGTFGIGKEITREEMTVLAFRAANISGVKLTKTIPAVDFSDIHDISEYALESVSAMRQAGIVNGAEESKFLPQNNSTRAEAAKIIYELIKYKENLD